MAAITLSDVEAWIPGNVTIDATIGARVIATVEDWVARHYDTTSLDWDAPTDEQAQALIMKAVQVYRRRFSPDGMISGADDLAAVDVKHFDQTIAGLLSGSIKTAGLFGPSSNTDDT